MEKQISDSANSKIDQSPLMIEITRIIKAKSSLYEHSYFRYALRSVYACLFLSLGTAIAFAVAMRSEEIIPNSGKFLFAFMFSWSLVMILFLNGELGTSNMLYMTIAYHKKILTFKKAVKILSTCLVFNLIGGIFFSFLISNTSPFNQLSMHNFFFDSISTKLAKSSLQIIIEGIFANIVVNIAVLICLKMKDDSAKVITTVFIIYIFAFLGYEHVIANFPALFLAYFSSHGQVENFNVISVVHNLFFALIGNYIGGGLIMGIGYSWLNSFDSPYLD